MSTSRSIPPPTVLEISAVSKSFSIRYDNSFKERVAQFGRASNREEFIALDDVSISLQAGHTIGLIGHNGSGKSTLLKIIGGIIEPTSGSVSRRGKIAALLELGAGFHPDLTGRENIYMNAAILGMSRAETESRFDEIVDFSGIQPFIDTQVKYYSSGMYVRLGFAVAIHTDPDILLVDEVLAVGDEAFQRKCLDKIAEFQRDGRTIVLVTHNLGQVVDMCDRAVLLDHGKKVFDGDPASAVNEFRKLLDHGVESTHVESEVVRAINIGDQANPHNIVGSDLPIQVMLAPIHEITSVICAIFITDSRGNPVFGASASLEFEGQERTEAIAGFLLKDIRFASGTYSVNVTIANGENHIHIENLVNAAQFTVVAPEPTNGVLYVDVETTFRQII